MHCLHCLYVACAVLLTNKQGLRGTSIYSIGAPKTWPIESTLTFRLWQECDSESTRPRILLRARGTPTAREFTTDPHW